MAVPEKLSAQGSILGMSQAQTAQFETRLNLTDPQKQAVRPIVTRQLRESEAIFKKHGVNPGAGKKPGLFQLVSLNNDMKGVNQWARAQLSKILSPVQMREYDKIYSEREAAIKNKLLR
jgi:hypothetical protein